MHQTWECAIITFYGVRSSWKRKKVAGSIFFKKNPLFVWVSGDLKTSTFYSGILNSELMFGNLENKWEYLLVIFAVFRLSDSIVLLFYDDLRSGALFSYKLMASQMQVQLVSTWYHQRLNGYNQNCSTWDNVNLSIMMFLGSKYSS